MPTPADNTLEARIAEVERAVRGLQSANLLDRASIQNAEGRHVPLADLAFGQVAARDMAFLSLNTNQAAWLAGTPALDVYVTGGRLRVDVAARLVCGGVNLRMGMSYRVTGPTDEPSAAGAEVVAPGEGRALLLKNQEGGSAEMAAGFPDLVEGLAAGWYRVEARYQLFGETQLSAAETFGNASNRRLFATPF